MAANAIAAASFFFLVVVVVYIIKLQNVFGVGLGFIRVGRKHIVNVYYIELRNAFVTDCESFARFRNMFLDNKMFKVFDRIGIFTVWRNKERVYIFLRVGGSHSEIRRFMFLSVLSLCVACMRAMSIPLLDTPQLYCRSNRLF